MPDISVVIVNWNTEKLLRDLLKSINENPGKRSLEIIVVDNSSSDGSTVMVEKNFPRVTLLKNKENLGFTKANNQGIKSAAGEIIVLLNPDTLVFPDTIDKLAEAFEKIPEAGIIGGMLIDGNGSIIPNCSMFPTFLRCVFSYTFLAEIIPGSRIKKDYWIEGWDRQDTREVDAVSGAYLAVRHKVLERTGLLDEKIYMYFEEYDICKRAKFAGWKVYYYPESKIIHYGGEASRQRDLSKTFKDSMFYYIKKHQGLTASLALKAVTAILYPISRIFKSRSRK